MYKITHDKYVIACAFDNYLHYQIFCDILEML